MKTYLFFPFLLLFSACQPSLKKSGQHNDRSVATNYETLYFKFENDSFKETLKTMNLDENTLKFELKIENKLKKEIKSIAGVAKNKDTIGNTEEDEDIDGLSYGALEYYYDGKCSFSIRMAIEKSNKVQINEGDCKTFLPNHFGIGKPWILKRMKG